MIPLVLILLLPPRAEAPRQPPRDAAVSTLPRRLLQDLRRLGTRTPLLSLAIGGGVAAGVHPGDARAARRLGNTGAFDEALDAGDTLGNGYTQGGGAVAVYAIGLLAHEPRVARLGSALVEAQGVEALVTHVLKVTVNRTRPNGGSESFPSGHAAASFTTADVLAQSYGWRVGIPAYAGAIYVAISRLTEQKHYVSDITFGAAIGIAASRALALGRRSTTTTIAPFAVRGGAGVLITRTQLW